MSICILVARFFSTSARSGRGRPIYPHVFFVFYEQKIALPAGEYCAYLALHRRCSKKNRLVALIGPRWGLWMIVTVYATVANLRDKTEPANF